MRLFVGSARQAGRAMLVGRGSEDGAPGAASGRRSSLDFILAAGPVEREERRQPRIWGPRAPLPPGRLGRLGR